MLNLVQDAAPVGRKWRKPKHPFSLATKPYDIQPFFVAPVLAGETMKNLLMQSRCVSDPIKNPLMGWWKEYYFFYVKLRDLPQRDALTNMLLNPQQDMSSSKTAVAAAHHYRSAASQMDYVNWMTAKIVEEYFRDQGQSAAETGGLLSGLYQAYAHSRDESWLDSLTNDAAMPDFDPNDVSNEDNEILRQQWEFMRAQKLSNMSFEQYLETFGVNTVVEANRPELVRYIKEWTYPANTINAATGAPSSALSWSISERADKDRFFKEPGFLFGVTVTRPKVYLSGMKSTLTGFMDNAMNWLPAIMADQPETSLKKFATGAGPLPQLTDVGGYWLDLRDLFLYGEQYLNYDLAASTTINKANLPDALGKFHFLTDAERTALFSVGTANLIREDGVVSLGILGAQVEMT